MAGWSYWSLTPSTDPSKPNFESKVRKLSREPQSTHPLTVILCLLQVLSRTYARAVAGTPTAMSFNGTTGHFSLTYTPDSDPTVAALGTEVREKERQRTLAAPHSHPTLLDPADLRQLGHALPLQGWPSLEC